MPVQSCNDSDSLDAEVIFHISHFETLPVMSDAISRETHRDGVLSRVYEQVMNVGKKGTMMNCLSHFIIA